MVAKKRFTVALLALLIVSLVLTGCGGEKAGEDAGDAGNSKKLETVVIRAQTKGAELTRVKNLEIAAEKLNEDLKNEGKNVQVKVESNAFEGDWDEYKKQFIMAFKSQNEPDIFVAAHEDIAWLAKGNYILPLDELKNSEAYEDVFPTLWEATIWNDTVWGVPQDTEARPVFYRKDKLKELGWSDEEINGLPEKVKNGEFTIDDMTQVAKEAINKNIVEWGIIHRPKSGPDFHMLTYNFGAQIYDEGQDKIVFEKDKMVDFFTYFYDLTQKEKVTPDALTTMDWKTVHQTMIDGKCLFYYGGIWNVFNYVEQGADYDDIMENFGFMLVPPVKKGGKPVTLSHPLLYTVSAQTEHKDLVFRLLEKVADGEFQAKHAVETCHLPINQKGADHPLYKEDEFLSSVTYMLDYTTFLPNTEGFKEYEDILFKFIQAVELGKMLPEEAVENMEKELNYALKDRIIVK